MAYNLNRKVLFMAKKETVEGQDASPTVSANVINVYDEPNFYQTTAEFIEKDAIRESNSDLPAVPSIFLQGFTPKCVLQGYGSSALGPASPYFVPLFEACAHSYALGGDTSSSSIVLKPLSVGFPSLSAYIWKHDTFYKILGSFGTFAMPFTPAQPIDINFNFQGRYTRPSSPGGGQAGLGAITRPTDLKTACMNEELTIGGYTPIWKSAEFNPNVPVNRRMDGNSDKGLYGLIPGKRKPMFRIQVELEADLSSKQWYQLMEDATLQGVSLRHKSTNSPTAQSIQQLNMPTAQIKNPSLANENDIGTLNIELGLPSATADNDYTLSLCEKKP